MTVAEASRQYQAQLEAVRSMFASDLADDEDRDQALEDLDEARREMEIAWLDQVAA